MRGGGAEDSAEALHHLCHFAPLLFFFRKNKSFFFVFVFDDGRESRALLLLVPSNETHARIQDAERMTIAEGSSLMTTAQLFSTDDVRSSGSKLRCESIRFVGTRSENKRRWGKEQMPVLFGRPVALLVSELDLEGATKWRKVSSALSEKGGNNFRALSWAT